MFVLLARSIPDYNGLRKARVESVPSLHDYWVISFPLTQAVEETFVNAGFLALSFDEQVGIASGSVIEWEAAMRRMSNSRIDTDRKVVTLLKQMFPDLFNGIKTTIRTDGTLCLT